MFFCFIIIGAGFLVLVNSHPLIQNLQAFPITSYQHAYLPSYNEAFMVQPSNINLYAQPVKTQNPIAPCQALQTPSLQEISQMYWEKVLVDPSVRNILDSNKMCDQHGNYGHRNSNPGDTARVVNNYIILPPDYLKINDTVEKPKTTRIKNVSQTSVRQNGATNERKKKIANSNNYTKDTKSTKKSRKVNQNTDESWSFNTQNIKCFTPVDVLKNEKYQPKKEIIENKRHKENRKRNRNSITNRANKKKSQKYRKANKIKNISPENNINETKTMNENRVKQWKSSSDMCKCKKRENSFGKTEAIEDIPRFCEQDIDDLLLSILKQQSCIDSNNRCTRNSKTDIAKTDHRTGYPNLPGDTSNSFNWYLNDFYSQQSLQQALNSNVFQGNKYPFDYSQIYQIPQYSHTDVNKLKGNTESNQNTRRKKKKKKKNSKTNTRKDSVCDVDNNTQSDRTKNNEIPEISTQITELNNETIQKTTQTYEILTAKVNPNISETSNNTNIELTNSINSDIKPIDLPDFIEEIRTESMLTTLITSVDKQDSGETSNDEIMKSTDYNAKSKEESKELYETQIPHSVILYTSYENTSEVPEVEESETDEMFPILGFDIYNQQPGFDDDEIFNMFMNDYYPDFRADNLAYLVNDEEIENRSIHDRYFYVTDKSSDSREIYSLENVQVSEVMNVDKLGNLVSEQDDNKSKVNEKEELQEVVFRTPPPLDVPDFRTRKVNRHIRDSAELFYEHNNVNDFDIFNLENFAEDSDNSVKPVHRNDNSGQIVETVYAKSKVVKYGQGQEVSKPRSEPKTVTSNVGTHNDGKPSVVLAKSLSPGEFW